MFIMFSLHTAKKDVVCHVIQLFSSHQKSSVEMAGIIMFIHLLASLENCDRDFRKPLRITNIKKNKKTVC